MKSQTLLLYVDDSEDDHILMQAAAESVNLPLTILGVKSFPEAVHYLSPGNPPPAVVLTDFHISCHTGIDLLRWVRGQALVSSLPVIVYSDSVDPRQFADCCNAGATCCLRKTGSTERSRIVLRRIYECLARTPVSLDLLAALPEYILGPALCELLEPATLAFDRPGSHAG